MVGTRHRSRPAVRTVGSRNALPSTCVALLRGVNNAGSGPRVAMSDLRALFERLGFSEVRTLLNSGNVVFSTRSADNGDIARRLESSLAEELRVAVPVVVLSRDEVVAALEDNPFGRIADNPSWLLVVIPTRPAARDRLVPLLEQPWQPERLAMGRVAAYLWCANGVARSRLWTAVERALDRGCTARNIATMAKLAALVRETSLG